MLRKFVFCLGIAAVVSSACPARADLITNTTQVQSIITQTFRVPGTSPLFVLGGVTPGDYDIRALGSFTVTWGNEVAGNTAPVIGFTATYHGTDGTLGEYSLTSTGTSTGELSSIVSAAGQLVSATLSINATFEFATPDFVAYTKTPAHFVGTLTPGGALGSVFTDPSRPDVLDLFAKFDLPLVGLVERQVATSFNRIVTAVPEPSGLALLAACLPMWRRKR